MTEQPEAQTQRDGSNQVTSEGELGAGGERHQHAGDGVPTMTTAQGTPISDDQKALPSGERGPQLLEDFVMRCWDRVHELTSS